LDDAVDHYQKALAIEPNVAAVLVNLGNALQSKEQFEEAIASYEKALAISPDPATEIALRQLRAKQLPPRRK
jgi:tetratricopeptide (TPR) repeat protein